MLNKIFHLVHFIFAILHNYSAIENVTIYFAPYPADNTNSIHFMYTKATCKNRSIPIRMKNNFIFNMLDFIYDLPHFHMFKCRNKCSWYKYMRDRKRKNEDRKRPCSIHIFMVFINLNVGGHLSCLRFSFVFVSHCVEMVVFSYWLLP